jgi:hypothetical protein
MKLKLIIFPLCLIAINTFAFEGSIRQDVKNYNGSGSNVTMTWYLSASKCRIDMTASGKDVNSNTVLILDPSSKNLKTYETTGAGPKQYFQVDAGSISGGTAILSVSPTQEAKLIDGYKCEKWIVVSSVGVYNIWVTKDIDFDWSGYKDFFKTSVEVQAMIHQGVKGFPMLTESASGSNNAAVESVSAHSLDSNTFEVPSQYTLFVPQAAAPGK